MKLMVTLLTRRLRNERIASIKPASCTCVSSGERRNKGRAILEPFPARAGKVYLKYHRCAL